MLPELIDITVATKLQYEGPLDNPKLACRIQQEVDFLVRNRNPLLHNLRAGRGSVGTMLTVSDPFVNEVVATAPFDFFVVDTEHSPSSMPELQMQLMALRHCGTSLLVRADRSDPKTIMQILDIGADGVVVPYVEDASSCAIAVRAARYPPDGNRGFGPRRAVRLHGARAEYPASANRDVIVLAQVESQEGVRNIDQILDVPDLTGVIVGPVDLASSFGHLDELDHEDVRNAKERIFGQCAAAGLPFGMFTSGSVSEAEHWLARGASMVTVGNDMVFFETGLRNAREHLEELRAGTSKDEALG
jgi:2-keto-3-deoxy-L-rhamnonate aldolase RhmA